MPGPGPGPSRPQRSAYPGRAGGSVSPLTPCKMAEDDNRIEEMRYQRPWGVDSRLFLVYLVP